MASISLVSPEDNEEGVGYYVGPTFKVAFTYLIGDSSEPWGYGDISQTELYINGDWKQTFTGWKESREYVFTRNLATKTEYTWQMAARVELEGEPTWERIWSEEWTFTTLGLPEEPINVSPKDAASNVPLSQATITWEDGGDGTPYAATSYDVYYGQDAGSLSLVSEGQAGLSFTITGIDYGSPFEYLVSRAWKIDAINDAGKTEGNIWTFAAMAFDPPLPTGVSLDASGEPTGTPTGVNNMMTVRKLVAAARNKIFYENI